MAVNLYPPGRPRCSGASSGALESSTSGSRASDSRDQKKRSCRKAAAWNVLAWTPGNPRAASRSRISVAALSVKVTTSTWPGWTAPVAIAYATRLEITRVLPVPAPARMHNGPAVVSTASRCAGFRSWVRNLGCTAAESATPPRRFHPAIHSRDRGRPSGSGLHRRAGEHRRRAARVVAGIEPVHRRPAAVGRPDGAAAHGQPPERGQPTDPNGDRPRPDALQRPAGAVPLRHPDPADPGRQAGRQAGGDDLAHRAGGDVDPGHGPRHLEATVGRA